MKTKQITAKTVETAYTAEDPSLMGLIVSNKDEQVNALFETMQAPAIAASIVLTSQDAVKKIDPETIKQGLAWNFESSAQILPEALDVMLTADGEVLSINIGSGVLHFRLTEPAKRSLSGTIAELD